MIGFVAILATDNICSNTKSIKYGVPQGSILGPLLFSIYVNDLNNCLNLEKCIMYADDTNIFKKVIAMKRYMKLQTRS